MRKLKLVTSLSTVALTSAIVLSGCGGEGEGEGKDASADDDGAVVASAGSGEGEGASSEGEGEGGEGEGGVAISKAGSDPVVYLSALAITEAHIIAARDAHALGEADAAAGMFAHPVSEVLFDMQPVFEQLGVEDFSDLLIEASEAVFNGGSSEEVAQHADKIIAALREAAKSAPDNGASTADIAAGVVADQIERASDMYRAAAEVGTYEPYLDGYGFFKAGEAAYTANATAIKAENGYAAEAIEAAFVLLADAYPNAGRQEELGADTGALSAAASNVLLSVSN